MVDAGNLYGDCFTAGERALGPDIATQRRGNECPSFRGPETGAGVMDGSRGTLAPPRPAVLWGIALAGVGAAACTVALRLTSDHGGAEPGLQAALLDWIVCSYILSGLIAWWRRPESRLGPLMVVGGFLTALSSLSMASAPLAVDDRPGRRPGPVRRLPPRLPRLPDRECSRAGWSGLW